MWRVIIAVITCTDTYTIGMTPLDDGSARGRDFYLTTHSVHKRQTSMPAAGF